MPTSPATVLARRIYKNRPDGTVPVQLNLTREAAQILAALSPTRKSYGHLLSRLLVAEATRQIERRRWLAQLEELKKVLVRDD
jgi:hypothetical protein